MRNWLRRARGAIGMGVTWAVAWSAVGTLPRWVFRINADAPFPLIFGVFGFVAGATFFGLLVLTQRRRSFDELSLPRFAAWGAAGGVLLSAVVARATSLGGGELLAFIPTLGLACAVCAAGSLALARRGLRQELPGARRHAVEGDLVGREQRELL